MPMSSAAVIWTWSMKFRFQTGSNSALANRSAIRFWTVSLPEVMVDAEDLRLVEVGQHRFVLCLRRREVVTDRLLDHGAHVRILGGVQAGLAETDR